MYEVDGRDRVVKLTDVPQSSIGAPIPFVVSDGHATCVAFYVDTTPADWDGSQRPRERGPDTEGEPIAMVKFDICFAHMFGPPNDEAFIGHPLSSRGLEPYGAFLIENSSWIRKLERMNSVHRMHRPEDYYHGRNHFVLSFHDDTFECVASGYFVQLHRGSINNSVNELLALLHDPNRSGRGFRSDKLGA